MNPARARLESAGDGTMRVPRNAIPYSQIDRRRDLTLRHEAAAAEIAARSQQSLIPSEDARPAAAAAVALARGANGGGEGDVIAYYFWVVIIFVFVLSLLNFVVLVAIAGAHNINLYSIDDVELVPEAQAVKFLRDVHLAEMTVRGGEIAGYRGEDLSVCDDGSVITARSTAGKKPEIRISSDSISAKNIESFNASDHGSSMDVTDLDAVALQSSDLEVLESRRVEVNEVKSGIGNDLMIKSDSSLDIEGTEGVTVEGRHVELSAGSDVTAESVEGAIVLAAHRLQGRFSSFR